MIFSPNTSDAAGMVSLSSNSHSMQRPISYKVLVCNFTSLTFKMPSILFAFPDSQQTDLSMIPPATHGLWLQWLSLTILACSPSCAETWWAFLTEGMNFEQIALARGLRSPHLELVLFRYQCHRHPLYQIDTSDWCLLSLLSSPPRKALLYTPPVMCTFRTRFSRPHGSTVSMPVLNTEFYLFCSDLTFIVSKLVHVYLIIS